MTAMTFLFVPNSTLAYQDTGGTGTLANDGSVSYASGYWAGVNGLSMPETVSLAAATPALDAASGSGVMRIKTPASFGAFYNFIVFGAPLPSPNFSVRFALTTGQLQANAIIGGAFIASSSQNATTSAETFVYFEWSTTHLGLALDANSVVPTAHSATNSMPAAGPITIGSYYPSGNGLPAGARIDGVALFDAALTDSERAFLRAATTPWTWNMPLVAPTSDPAPLRTFNVRTNALLRR